MKFLEMFDQANEVIASEDANTLQLVKNELHGLIDDVVQMYEIGEDAAAHLVMACILVGAKLRPDGQHGRAVSPVQHLIHHFLQQ